MGGHCLLLIWFDLLLTILIIVMSPQAQDLHQVTPSQNRQCLAPMIDILEINQMLSKCSMFKKRNENKSRSIFFYHYYVHAGGVKQHCCYIEMCHCRP